MLFFIFNIVGHYLPILAQIFAIYFSMIGNWNELIYFDLKVKDQSILVNSHMLIDLQNEF
jgi:hypothetical protein